MFYLSKIMAVPVLACMALLGCQQSAEPVGVTQQVESTVADVMVTAPNPMGTVLSTYQCDNDQRVTALYDYRQVDKSHVTLTIDGSEYQLYNVPAASGARYATEQGLVDEQGLQWHSKGTSAIALTLTLDHTAKPEDEKILFSCREVVA